MIREAKQLTQSHTAIRNRVSIHLEKQLIFRACDLEGPLTWLLLVNPDLGSVIPSIRTWDIQIKESVSLSSPYPHPRVLGNFYKLALPMFTVCFEMDYNPLYSDEEEVSERLKPPKPGFIGLPDIKNYNIWLTPRKR